MSQFGISDKRLHDKISPLIRNISAQLGLPIVDMAGALKKEKRYFSADGIHPLAAGSAEMARQVAHALHMFLSSDVHSQKGLGRG